MVGNFYKAFGDYCGKEHKEYKPVDQDKLNNTNRFWSENYFHKKIELQEGTCYLLFAHKISFDGGTTLEGVYTDWDLMMNYIDTYLAQNPNPHINWDVKILNFNFSPVYTNLEAVKEESKEFYKSIGWSD